MGFKQKDYSQALYEFMNQYTNTHPQNTEEMQEDDTFVENDWMQNSNVISGMGIQEDDQPDDSLDDLMKNVNSQNSEAYEKEMERLRKEQEEQEESDRKIREAAQAKRLQEMVEEEQKVREQMRLEEEEEERRLAEELEAKRKANPLFRLKEAASDMTAKSVAAFQKKAEDTEEAADETAKEEKPVKKAKTEKPAKEKKKVEKKKTEITSQTEKGNEKSDEKSTPDFEYLATHDQLTGLKNLTAYEMATKECDAKKCAIIFCDINNLKVTNDTFGHATGNKLIIKVSDTLKELFADSVYRIGGDEFVILLTEKKISDLQKSIEGKIRKFRSAMEQATKDDTDGLVYSASIGYAVGDGKKTITELQEEADKAMYANKQAYKAAEKKKPKKKEEKPKPQDVDYDSLLPDEQRMLKEVIKDNHCQASEESTEKILREIQSRYNEIIAILIASPTFDYLFIVQDVENFLGLAAEIDSPIDYSYLYVVYENGTQFYGVDEYFDEVTVLFTEIGKTIKTSPYVSDKELLKIKGINIFKQIYFD